MFNDQNYQCLETKTNTYLVLKIIFLSKLMCHNTTQDGYCIKIKSFNDKYLQISDYDNVKKLNNTRSYIVYRDYALLLSGCRLLCSEFISLVRIFLEWPLGSK